MLKYGDVVWTFGLLLALSTTTTGLIHSVCYGDAESLSQTYVNDDKTLDDLADDHVVLVVNTASFCTYTHQYPDINRLQNHFGDRLRILAFPCNQFGHQEPGVGQEILNTIRYVRPGNGYIPNFYMNQKIEVNGANAHPLFAALHNSCPPAKVQIGDHQDLYWTPIAVGDITWNFNKFLLDANGVPFKRFDSTVEPLQLIPDIESLLDGTYASVERPERPNYFSN